MNMHRPKYHHKARIALAAIMAIMAGGCTQSDEPDPERQPSGSGASVMFGAYVNGTSASRAYVADIEHLKKTGFGVFASRGDEDYNPDPSGSFTSDFMHNQEVVWKAADNGGGTWTYDPVKSWPGSKLSFFAYAPFFSQSATTGITGVSAADSKGAPKVTFVMDGDVDRQTDLLYADTEKTLNLVNAGQVQFVFKHALSRISFKCASDLALDGSTTVTLNSVSLSSADLAVSGELNLATGAWENLRTEEKKYTIGKEDFIGGGKVITSADGTTASDLTTDGKYLMIIPSGTTVPVKLTVNYDVETIDPLLTGGKIKFTNELTGNTDFNFETGKSYCLTLRLGIKALDISVGVTEWDTSDNGWVPTPVEKKNN